MQPSKLNLVDWQLQAWIERFWFFQWTRTWPFHKRCCSFTTTDSANIMLIKRCWPNIVESESVFYLVSSLLSRLLWMREIGGCKLLLRASDSLFQWIGHLPSDLFVTVLMDNYVKDVVFLSHESWPCLAGGFSKLPTEHWNENLVVAGKCSAAWSAFHCPTLPPVARSWNIADRKFYR